MRIDVAAVGRLGPAERSLAEDYASRIRNLGRKAGITAFGVKEVAESRAATAELRRAEEARRLLAALPSRAYCVALDERGEDFSSSALAALLRRLLDQGEADAGFLIGGPDGHGPAVLEGARTVMAFGRATWPHRLVRVMLAEQIYRSVTILLNHPYHRA
jgi:23S rRNA (pseudouridine1915-N3)-methyltransferase